MKTTIINALLFISVIFTACSDDDEPQTQPDSDPLIPRRDIALSNDQKEVLNGVKTFSFGLLRDLSGSGSTDNVVISPLGVQMSLAMAANGASDQTLDEMKQLLGISSLENLNSLNSKLISEFPNLCNRVKFTSAHSMWIDNDYTTKQAFSDLISRHYGAGVFGFDRYSSEGRNSMNKWVSDHTGGGISSFLNENPKFALAIFDTSIFDGKWKSPFDESNTKNDSFYSTDGTFIATVPMMKRKIVTKYTETDQYQAVVMPYGNEAFRMIVILPRRSSSPANIVNLLDNGEMHWAYEPSLDYEVDLTMPRVAVSYKSDLKESLRNMGMTRAFTSDAEFDGIIEQSSIFLESVNHASILKIDEAGTKVTTATSVISGDIDIVYPEVRMTIDRPFVFLIDEVSTGAILYAGVINNPTK